jgi:myo-inositol-1(or 4)-monophosphatase
MKDFLVELAQEAGRLALAYRARGQALQVDFKSARDLVTEADRAIEEMIVAAIARRYPEHGVTGEEGGDQAGREYRWIIDPIDGTASFVHDQPFFSVSIAVERAGELVLGAVGAPALGELYVAERGGGAWCNGRRLQVSRRAHLGESMLATGFACLRSGLPENNLPYLVELLPRLRDLRRYGSAAIDLAYVAAGRLEGFWELNLHEYDVAAGLLLVTEAGGRYSDFAGARTGLYGELVATNGLVHAELLATLATVRAARQGAGGAVRQ